MIPGSAFFQIDASILNDLNLLGVVGPVLGALVVGGITVLFVSRYRRCPANKVLVISGRVWGAMARPSASPAAARSSGR
jgi:uncharacterized membrane protein YqiK